MKIVENMGFVQFFLTQAVYSLEAQDIEMFICLNWGSPEIMLK